MLKISGVNKNKLFYLRLTGCGFKQVFYFFNDYIYIMLKISVVIKNKIFYLRLTGYGFKVKPSWASLFPSPLDRMWVQTQLSQFVPFSPWQDVGSNPVEPVCSLLPLILVMDSMFSPLNEMKTQGHVCAAGLHALKSPQQWEIILQQRLQKFH